MGLKAYGFRFRGLGHRTLLRTPTAYTLHPALRIRVVQGCKAQFSAPQRVQWYPKVRYLGLGFRG